MLVFTLKDAIMSFNATSPYKCFITASALVCGVYGINGIFKVPFIFKNTSTVLTDRECLYFMFSGRPIV